MNEWFLRLLTNLTDDSKGIRNSKDYKRKLMHLNTYRFIITFDWSPEQEIMRIIFGIIMKEIIVVQVQYKYHSTSIDCKKK